MLGYNILLSCCVTAEGILVKGKNALEVLPITEGVIGGFNRLFQVRVTSLTVVMNPALTILISFQLYALSVIIMLVKCVQRSFS